MSYRDYDDMPSRRERIRGNKGSSVGIAAAICILVCLLILLICLLVSTGKDEVKAQGSESVESSVDETITGDTELDTIPLVEIQAGEEKISLEIPIDNIEEPNRDSVIDVEANTENISFDSSFEEPIEELLNEENSDIESIDRDVVDESSSIEEILFSDVSNSEEIPLEEAIEETPPADVAEDIVNDGVVVPESEVAETKSSADVLTELEAIEPIVIDVNEMESEAPLATIEESDVPISDSIDLITAEPMLEEEVEVATNTPDTEIIEPDLNTEAIVEVEELEVIEDSTVEDVELKTDIVDEAITSPESEPKTNEIEPQKVLVEEAIVVASRDLESISVTMELLSDNTLNIKLPEKIDYKSALSLGMKIQRTLGYSALFKNGVISISLDSAFADIESIFDKLEGVIVPAFRTKR